MFAPIMQGVPDIEVDRQRCQNNEHDRQLAEAAEAAKKAFYQGR